MIAKRLVALIVVATASSFAQVNAAQLKLLLPLGRTSYQTNESIDVAVVRTSDAPLAAGSLQLIATGDDGKAFTFSFPAKGAPLVGATATKTEMVRIDARFLKPERYTIEADCDGATASTDITVYDHIRASTYKTIHWGGPQGDALIGEGKDGLGFNLIFTAYTLNQEQSIAAGEDVMGLCLMGGGHQDGLKPTNDWSDPNVYFGSIQRGVDRAFQFRTMPNAIGAHLHDEPGLTWLINPHTGKISHHDIPTQRAAYTRAYGEDPIWSDETDTSKPDQYEAWTRENDFKFGFMDALWKSTDEAISRLKPGFLSVTQSQYGWWAFYDGYYFNVARSLPVISGHGGYDSYWEMNFNPSLFVEMALPRQTDKPTWYLPEWDGGMSPDLFCEEHNLCFITGIQGMSAPPSCSVKAASAPGLQASNKLFQRIGTIFEKPETTPQDVAILYSKSNQMYLKEPIHSQIGTVYLATKLLHYPISALLEEDILDGSLAAKHKAVIVTGVTHLDQPVIDGLVAFIKGGGTVIQTADVTVDIPGAVKIAVDPETVHDAALVAAGKLTDPKERGAAIGKLSSFDAMVKLAEPVAKALAGPLEKAGIRPPFRCDLETMAAGKQVRGEIEYDFAVNFTYDPAHLALNGCGLPIPATATIAFPDDGRVVYDAVTSTQVPCKKKGGELVATLPFGPGQMAAFARTRPIGGVSLGAPSVTRDYTRADSPIRVDIAAALDDTDHALIAGTAPMEVALTDPSGATRYDIYRAANNGVLALSLPLAANDPAGEWTATVTELLSGKKASAKFAYTTAGQCGAAAGELPRAAVFADDEPNIFKFFRDHRHVIVVPGSNAWDLAAAKRFVENVAPYNVTATIVGLDDANKARPITDAQAATWCGDNNVFGSLSADARKLPQVVGYNLDSPTVLIGSVADNPLIAYLATKKVLAYTPTAEFPGPGRGLVAWNMMTLGHDIEALALIGTDEAAVGEAVGTAFQIGVGIEPPSKLIQPTDSAIVTKPKAQ